MEKSCCWIIRDPKKNNQIVPLSTVVELILFEASSGFGNSVHIPTGWDKTVREKTALLGLTLEPYDEYNPSHTGQEE
jgi:hypothetical protein